jgi:hypothetical protein
MEHRLPACFGVRAEIGLNPSFVDFATHLSHEAAPSHSDGRISQINPRNLKFRLTVINILTIISAIATFSIHVNALGAA